MLMKSLNSFSSEFSFETVIIGNSYHGITQMRNHKMCTLEHVLRDRLKLINLVLLLFIFVLFSL